MRTPFLALLALLPLLAAPATAHAHGAAKRNEHGGRKSIAFGPELPHNKFEAAPAQSGLRRRDASPREAAVAFIAEKVGAGEGDGFYIRDDTYTDERTKVTHVFARQLINGFEVGDGDINVNVAPNGEILSFGNSFHPEKEVPQNIQARSLDRERDLVCSKIEEQLDRHRKALAEATPGTGAWEIVKTAAKAWLGFGDEDEPTDPELIEALETNYRKIQEEHQVRCDKKLLARAPLSPTEALALLVPRLSNNLQGINASELTSTTQEMLGPKKAPAEPPTELISGQPLKNAQVVSEVPARTMYTQTTGGAPVMVYRFDVEMEDNWYEAYVSTDTGEIIRIVDWASDSHPDHHRHSNRRKRKPSPAPSHDGEYFVFPFGVNDPSVGSTKREVNPADKVASPLGWHTFPTNSNPWPNTNWPGSSTEGENTFVSSTVGNNVLAHENWGGRNNFLTNYRPVANGSLNFVYEYGEPEGLAPKEYADFAITQLFYTCNKFHDLLHRYGFDEASGNFQMDNFGRGGRGGDPVIANAQDGSGTNNANFATPPDGQAPRMRMYVWDTATPYRDGDLETGIVIHEYAHGLSTRLTGGPMNSGCLGFGESGGMGEGWGDFIATLVRQTTEHKGPDDTFTMGAWAANSARGIRNYPYTTDTKTNPATYTTLDGAGYSGVHAMGGVWAEMLFVMSQRLVEKHGFSNNLFPPEDPSQPNEFYAGASCDSASDGPLVPKHGNTLALQLVISGMKLQPCRPTFFDARDAIIQADKVLTGGANKCILWKAFAERGLGVDAANNGRRTNGFRVPSDCN